MTVEQYAEFCEKCHKADKDAKDLLLQAYKRGVEEGKRIALADLAEHDKEVRNKTIEEVLQTIRNGMSELLESPWADYRGIRFVKDVFGTIDDLILTMDIEQMKEGGKNANQ